ncbi:MAG TPA: LPS assembly lipoprotein LptE [Burkholderiaceae bacterium]|nr:LPS assembly lipoprotein LptE [Burkholderiaceae bacterium]
MLMKRRIACALAVAATVTLSACGFQLRGSGNQANLPFATVYLAFPDTSALGNELKRNLRAGGGTEVITDAKTAQAIVELLSETREKQILSLNTQGRVREYSLLYRVRFRVRDSKGKELLAPTEIVLKRDISFNEAQVIAKEKEEEMLYRDMQSDLVQQILRRLAVLKPG